MLLMAICCACLNEALMPVGTSTSRHWERRTVWEVVIMTWNDLENRLSWKMQAHNFVRCRAKCLPRFVGGKKEPVRREQRNEICFYTLLYTSNHFVLQCKERFRLKSKLTLVFKVPPQLVYLPGHFCHLFPSPPACSSRHRPLTTVLTTCWFSKNQTNICSMPTICSEFY